MTTPDTSAKTFQVQGRLRLPDPPEREPEDMTSFDRLTATGNAYLLIEHLGNPETHSGVRRALHQLRYRPPT